ncbi:hypothetical protein L484_026607 [Morus notabilis]|uniref:Uncharacterized protein n=1 Tax=Morus notabilis TaxID=981085 RepID=W9T0L9_9ROSA|nr:hypothetical protein L484_026607 [Morus notabilis]
MSFDLRFVTTTSHTTSFNLRFVTSLSESAKPEKREIVSKEMAATDSLSLCSSRSRIAKLGDGSAVTPISGNSQTTVEPRDSDDLRRRRDLYRGCLSFAEQKEKNRRRMRERETDLRSTSELRRHGGGSPSFNKDGGESPSVDGDGDSRGSRSALLLPQCSEQKRQR